MTKMAQSNRIKSLSLSNILFSAMPLQLEVFTNSVKKLHKLELLSCDLSTIQLEGLLQNLLNEDNSLKELNLTNTQMLEVDPSILAECSLRLEKICLSNLTENQTLRIFKSLSMLKTSNLKALSLDGVTEFDECSNESSYVSKAITKLENFSIKFKHYQSPSSLWTTSFLLFIKLLILEQSKRKESFCNDEISLKEISIFNRRLPFQSDTGKWKWSTSLLYLNHQEKNTWTFLLQEDPDLTPRSLPPPCAGWEPSVL